METDKRIATLTEREKICLRQWPQHKTAKQIAADLNISHHAVEKRLKIARIKLGTTSSRHAALILREAERSDQTVPHLPDLQDSHPTIHPSTGPKMIIGGIGMTLLAAALFALALHPSSDAESTQTAAIGGLIGEYDAQLDEVLRALIASAEVGPDGEVRLLHAQSDSRFLEPNSGYYWQISSEVQGDFKSRSLWERRLDLRKHSAPTPIHYDSNQFSYEPLRVVEQTVLLSNSQTRWNFAVARSPGRQK
ncbi:helix-turn-helix domain-containing protein [Sphingomonas sp.]|uniref:helix-turn-helix domain-containing protein n=1 Tax=Sphingomonas sp. TaxID=28214 RepID=UPI002E13ECDB|nr:helix-turn-helix domain-containing protein [Sphingomonas sp.]